jgi:hypothetical protein
MAGNGHGLAGQSPSENRSQMAGKGAKVGAWPATAMAVAIGGRSERAPGSPFATPWLPTSSATPLLLQ